MPGSLNHHLAGSTPRRHPAASIRLKLGQSERTVAELPVGTKSPLRCKFVLFHRQTINSTLCQISLYNTEHACRGDIKASYASFSELYYSCSSTCQACLNLNVHSYRIDAIETTRCCCALLDACEEQDLAQVTAMPTALTGSGDYRTPLRATV